MDLPRYYLGTIAREREWKEGTVNVFSNIPSCRSSPSPLRDSEGPSLLAEENRMSDSCTSARDDPFTILESLVATKQQQQRVPKNASILGICQKHECSLGCGSGDATADTKEQSVDQGCTSKRERRKRSVRIKSRRTSPSDVGS